MPDRQLMERDAANDLQIGSKIDNQDLAHQANRKPRAGKPGDTAERAKEEEAAGAREDR